MRESDRTRRGSYPRGERAKRRIVETALAQFAEHGYGGASLGDIAQAAGISKPGVLYHFPNKEAVLIAVLQERDARTITGSRLGDMSVLVGTEILDAWDEVAEINAGRYGLVQLSHVLSAESCGGDHPAAEHFRDHWALGRSLLATALRRGIESGELREGLDTSLLADQIIGMMEGLENQWLHDPEGFDFVGAFHDYTRMVRSWIRRSAD